MKNDLSLELPRRTKGAKYFVRFSRWRGILDEMSVLQAQAHLAELAKQAAKAIPFGQKSSARSCLPARQLSFVRIECLRSAATTLAESDPNLALAHIGQVGGRLA